MKTLYTISFVLLVIGGLNWLLEGFNWNLVEAIFGAGTTITKIVYIIVGLATLIVIFARKGICKNCENSTPAPQM